LPFCCCCLPLPFLVDAINHLLLHNNNWFILHAV
jgi:hypothetical protein